MWDLVLASVTFSIRQVQTTFVQKKWRSGCLCYYYMYNTYICSISAASSTFFAYFHSTCVWSEIGYFWLFLPNKIKKNRQFFLALLNILAKKSKQNQTWKHTPWKTQNKNTDTVFSNTTTRSNTHRPVTTIFSYSISITLQDIMVVYFCKKWSFIDLKRRNNNFMQSKE